MAEDQEQEDRTEEPTERRIQQAIERGDVAKSQEVNTFFILGGIALSMLIFATPAARDMTLSLKGFLGNAHQIPTDPAGIRLVFERIVIIAAATAGLPILIMAMAALLGSSIQHRLLWTFEPLTPKPSRLSPLAGAKRVFGKEALVQFVKGLAKIGIVGVVVWLVLSGESGRIINLARIDPIGMLPVTRDIAIRLFGSVLAVFIFVAAGDFLYQKMAWRNRLRMTKQELKEEFKETEGSPEVKAKIRQLRQQVARRRMMAKVPQATVVIANPTHFAVALQYERGMDAPVCLAKGVDSLALRIRALAEENGIPVVENPPLARALHATVQLDEQIPVEHYKAVAEVVGYVLRLRQRRA